MIFISVSYQLVGEDVFKDTGIAFLFLVYLRFSIGYHCYKLLTILDKEPVIKHTEFLRFVYLIS